MMVKIGFFFLVALTPALAQESLILVVPDKIHYSEGLRVRQNIKTECNLELGLADHIAHQASSVYREVHREIPKGEGYHILDMEITGAFGAGGGAWSGPKSVEVRGTLKDHKGQVLGTFTGHRYSMGGAFGGVMGTCKILKRCTRAIAKDIALYLISPTRNAQLGDR